MPVEGMLCFDQRFVCHCEVVFEVCQSVRNAPLAVDLNEQRAWLRRFQGAHKMRSPNPNGGVADMRPCLDKCTGKAKMNHVPTSRSMVTEIMIVGVKILRSVAASLLGEGVVVVVVLYKCILNGSEPVVVDSLSSGTVLCCAMMSPPRIVRCGRIEGSDSNLHCPSRRCAKFLIAFLPVLTMEGRVGK